MSIVDNKTVDGIALTDDNNGIILLIADHMDWRDEYQHLVMLQEKINVYITSYYIVVVFIDPLQGLYNY